MHTSRDALLRNLLWLLGSLAVAFAVWFVATIQANPIQQQQFLRVPVRLAVPDGLIVTNTPPTTVRVIVRAQQSVLDLLTVDDIDVVADVGTRGAGTHSIPLAVTIARPASADTQPTQLRVALEQVVVQQKPVRIEVASGQGPSADFGFEDPVAERAQVAVSGAANDVNAVAAVRGDVDLRDQRNPLELDVQLYAVNADGRRINDVVIEPGSVRVQVNIFRRDNVRQFSVSPDILIGTLDSDYTLTAFDYRPETVFVSGSPEQLSAIGDILRTEPISLQGRTEDFVTRVPLRLPEDNLLVIDGQTSIEVTIGIAARTTARQIDNIPVETIGLPDGYTLGEIAPNTISVLLSGPVSVINSIQAGDVQAVLDLSGVEAGNNDIAPTILLAQGQESVDRIELLPASLNVAIAAPQPTPEATPETTPVVAP